jgi:hypothetical protein
MLLDGTQPVFTAPSWCMHPLLLAAINVKIGSIMCQRT